MNDVDMGIWLLLLYGVERWKDGNVVLRRGTHQCTKKCTMLQISHVVLGVTFGGIRNWAHPS